MMDQISYIQEQLEHAIRRAEHETETVSEVRREENMGVPVMAGPEIQHGVRVVPLVRPPCIDERGSDDSMEHPKTQELYTETLIEDEEKRIIEDHGMFVDDHQAYAVMLEEYEEAAEELKRLGGCMDRLWFRVREDDPDNADVMEEIDKIGRRLIAEAVQVVACSRKYMRGALRREIEKRATKV